MVARRPGHCSPEDEAAAAAGLVAFEWTTIRPVRLVMIAGLVVVVAVVVVVVGGLTGSRTGTVRWPEIVAGRLIVADSMVRPNLVHLMN